MRKFKETFLQHHQDLRLNQTSCELGNNKTHLLEKSVDEIPLEPTPRFQKQLPSLDTSAFPALNVS